jgi:hypothetical protein
MMSKERRASLQILIQDDGRRLTVTQPVRDIIAELLQEVDELRQELGRVPIGSLASGSAARAIAEARDFYRDIAESSDAGVKAIESARLYEVARHVLEQTSARLQEAEAALKVAENAGKFAHRQWDKDQEGKASFANTLRAVWNPIEDYFARYPQGKEEEP